MDREEGDGVDEDIAKGISRLDINQESKSVETADKGTVNFPWACISPRSLSLPSYRNVIFNVLKNRIWVRFIHVGLVKPSSVDNCSSRFLIMNVMISQSISLPFPSPQKKKISKISKLTSVLLLSKKICVTFYWPI